MNKQIYLRKDLSEKQQEHGKLLYLSEPGM